MDLKINRRQFFLIILDTVQVPLAYLLSLLLRFDFAVPGEFIANLIILLPLIVFIWLSVFYIFGLYRRVWAMASVIEAVSILQAVFTSTLLLFVASWLAGVLLPRSAHLIAFFLCAAFVGGSRFALRLWTRYRTQGSNGHADTRVLVVGAGEAGVMVAEELERHFSCRSARAVGFADDDPGKQRCSIHGVKVLGTSKDIPRLVEEHKIDEIIIAIPSAPRETIGKIARLCSQLPVKVKTLPGMYELISGEVSINKIRAVQIEDLLGREEVRVDLEEMASYLDGETVLVTGAGGSIGSELCRQVASFCPSRLLLLDHCENSVYEIEREIRNDHPDMELIPLVADIRDYERVESIFSKYNPGVIYHAAAHKHVPLMEANREEAIQNNIFGTRNVAEAAHRHKAKRFLLVSTDKAVNPTSVMGATKRVAEMEIQSLACKSKTRFCAVRFGNVLGSRGSVIPLFKEQIAQGGPVTVTDPEMTRYFMTIPESVQLIIQAGAMGEQGEIFVLDMGNPVKIVDLAKDLIRLSGFEPEKDIPITFNGIRPGEKLYEELLTSEEGILSTKHERIFIAGATKQCGEEFAREMVSLRKLLKLDMTVTGKDLSFKLPCVQPVREKVKNATG